MISPLTAETEWLTALSDLPLWTPPDSPMLVIVPHPDDESLGAGGLIAYQVSRGVSVTIAAVTDGEMAYPSEADLAERRRAEHKCALDRLGVDPKNVVRFHLPDSGVMEHQAELTKLLSALTAGATHIVAPWSGDFHPDHRACGLAAEEIADRTGALLTSYFFWTWHHATFDALRNLKLVRFPIDSGLKQIKLEALACHRSQLAHDHVEPILPPELLAPASRPFEIFGIA